MGIKQALLASLMATGIAAHAAEGMKVVESVHPVVKTMDRLAEKVKAAGFRVFARVDHGAGAKSVDMSLPPTELLIFGNPKGGTALMQSSATIGIDLPLKYLVWEDADGTVQVGWNDPAWMAGRHQITDKGKVVDKVAGALNKFASEAVQP